MLAALYLRSSKDRSDVSLAAQRHELEKLAASRSLQIAKSYEDAVESGSTDDRPGFIELVRALKNPQRGWSHLLVYDTSRLARRRYIAQAIKHEAKKRGVVILYARMPADLDPVAELVLESVFEAMDEAHSLMSREKGLAGMAENVRRGWRAGGRAPFGYSLDVHATGTIRDGKPVTKTKLIPNEHARIIAKYLKDRATGTPRVVAAKGIAMSMSSLIGIEWNALAYAGHTVWNRHAQNGSGHKRRRREDWQITRNTHPALITDAEAEALLSMLENSDIGRAVSQAKAAISTHLLTGFLYTSDGQPWTAHRNYYRLKSRDGTRGKLFKAATLDAAISKQVQIDAGSDLFLGALLAAAKQSQMVNDPAVQIDARIKQLQKEKEKAAQLALTSDGPTFSRLVEERSRQIQSLEREADALRKDNSLSVHVATMTVEHLRELVTDIGPGRAIETFVERIILDADLSCRMHYKVVPGSRRWLSMASPKGFTGSPPGLIREVVIGSGLAA